jgi:hypothetical protein
MAEILKLPTLSAATCRGRAANARRLAEETDNPELRRDLTAAAIKYDSRAENLEACAARMPGWPHQIDAA